ncbi:FAD-dependent monooxygenase [Bradyrhizobium sp. Cp5.3]|uniref:FAD-dependent monooxygenase n=1 Tax=Bradyrhizobium sp. Cp5.3 TaxID=443598 RepID=UPI0018DD48DB|nr:FAD-dependent monooxygenase [Bradyrhizobium sp. Cp5.3]
MAATDSVAIVGAEPFGLVTASAIARAGVPVAIFERGREIVSSPRAITHRWLARPGLLEDALASEFAKQDYTYLA